MAAKSILEHEEVDRLIRLALDEDGVARDLTTEAALYGVKNSARIRATILAKQETTACGAPLARRVLEIAGVSADVSCSVLAEEGAVLKKGAPWILLEGPAADLLRLERTILNFLMRMCGIAQATREAVKALEGTGTKLLHTRKTAPGHRRTDVYAACTGGAEPHRRSLDDAILVKENHIRTASSFQSLTDGINATRAKARFVEIEVTDFVELKYALLAKPDRILLDNFSLDNLRKAVEIFGASEVFEASGNISLRNVREVAETGVNFVSMGGITHSAPGADLSMLFDFKDA